MGEISKTTKEKLELNYDMFSQNTYDKDITAEDFRTIKFTVKDNSTTIYDDEGNLITLDNWQDKDKEVSIELLVHNCEDRHIDIDATDFFNEDGSIKEEYANDEEKIYFVKDDKEG